MRATHIYSALRRHGKHATLVDRTRTVDRLTGMPTLTEQRWSGTVGFVPNIRQPREGDVVVADAWILTEQPLRDDTEVNCEGKAYRVLKLTTFDGYNVASLKAAAPAGVYCDLNSYQNMVAEIAEVPLGTTYLTLGDNHEQIDELSSVPT